MMRGGLTLLILGHMQVVDDERRNPVAFWSLVRKGQLWHSTYESCWHDKDESFCIITFKLRLYLVCGEGGGGGGSYLFSVTV